MENKEIASNDDANIKHILGTFIERLQNECSTFLPIPQYTELKNLKKFEQNDINFAIESIDDKYLSLDKKCLSAMYTNQYEWFNYATSDDRDTTARYTIKKNIAMLNKTLLNKKPNLAKVLFNLEESFKLSIQSNILSQKELNINFYSPPESTGVYFFMNNLFINIKTQNLYKNKDESIIELIDFIKPYSDLTIKGYENQSGNYNYDANLSTNEYLTCQRNYHYRKIIIKKPLTLETKKYLIEQTNELEKRLIEDKPNEFGNIKTSICERYEKEILNIIEENKLALKNLDSN